MSHSNNKSRRERTRPKRNPALAEFYGWLLGGVAALVAAVILLNSGLVDSLRARIYGKPSESSFIEGDSNPAESGNLDRTEELPKLSLTPDSSN